jgi:ankyrin repeat protein
MVKALLDHGANVNDKSNDGTTALGLAISQKHPDIEVLLRAKGAQ